MNVLLVFPYFGRNNGQPPLGIASLYAYLKSEIPDINIQVFDGMRSKNKFSNFEKIITATSYDVIGFTVQNLFIRNVINLARVIRKISPRTKIIMGGPQVTIDPEYFIDIGLADAVVRGEGEKAFLLFLKNQCEPKGIDGFVYRESGKIIYEQEQIKLINLSELPLMDRSIFDMESYIKVWSSLDIFGEKLRGTSVMVTRGCPYQCAFCQPTKWKLFGKNVRKYSPEKVIKELKHLRDTYNLTAFMFEDDTFIIDKEWVQEVCRIMLESNLNMFWCCNVRADLCDYDILKNMFLAGLRKIHVGIESASQKILDEVYKKGITIKQVIDTVDMAKQVGLYVHGYFMLGHPMEKEADIQKTIRFAGDLDIDEATFSITTPIPGTDLFDSDKGCIKTDFENFDYYSSRCVYDAQICQVSPLRISFYKKYAYFYFYLKKGRLAKQLRNLYSFNGLKQIAAKLKRILR